MTLHYRLIFCIVAVLGGTPATAHEFWIEPSAHYAEPGTSVGITLKVGETFRGSAQPYLNDEVEKFLVLTDVIKAIPGLLGDSRPAAKVTLNTGLHQIIHLTTPSSIRFGDGDKRWENYIQLDGLRNQLEQYPDIPQSVPITERYIRCAKSLIKSGSDRTTDYLSGQLPFELVLNGSWSTIDKGVKRFTLFDSGKPLAGILIKAFRQSDRAVVSEAYTDKQGQIRLDLPTNDRYLISGVVIRPDIDRNYNWISHWPTLTIQVTD